MRHLMTCMKPYRTVSVLAPLFKLFEAAMELTVPLVVGAIVDVGIANGDRGYVVSACLLLAAFGLAGLAFALTAQFFAAKAAVGTSAELRHRLFEKLLSFSYAQIDDMGTASMVTRMTSDVNQVQNGVNMTLRILLRSPIVVFGAALMAFFVDPYGGLVILGVIPLLMIVVFAVMALTVPRNRAVQEKLDDVYLSARENLAGARVIRAFRMEKKEEAEFEQKSKSLLGEQIGVGRIAALTAPLTFALVNLAVIVLIWVGALRVELGSLSQGDVLALYNYLALILVELIKFVNLIVTVSKSVSCMKRIGAVLDSEGEERGGVCPEPDKTAPHIAFEDVSFTYPGAGAPALEGITFTVAAGETVGILGGTGSGKSTLVRLLPRFYEIGGGSLKVWGREISSIPKDALRKSIGYVPQRAQLFAGTIASNLRWGNEEASDEALLHAAELAEARDVVEAKGGIYGPVAQEGRNLSGGQRQRLTIARALVKDPDILVLDDSSSALDYRTDARLGETLKSLPQTVFLVSQRVSSVMRADKIIVLDEGRIAGMGTHDELMAGCELYRRIYESQTEETA